MSNLAEDWMSESNYSDKAVTDLVLGLGASGYSCLRFLHREGHKVRVADSRLQPPQLQAALNEVAELDVHLGPFTEALLDGIERLIVSPGLSPDEPLVQEALRRGIAVIGDIDIFARHVKAPVIAITGSNGKSTVTSWLAHVLNSAGHRALAGGNLGTPALDLLGQDVPDYYVLELSSFQLERTRKLSLTTAAILNLSADHIDYHGSIESYHAAKKRILNDAASAVIYAPLHCEIEVKDSASVLWYQEDCTDSVDYCLQTRPDNSVWLHHRGSDLMPVEELKVVGLHNYLNALAVIAMAEQCGLDFADIKPGLTSFAGLPHRMQWVGESDDVTWINDSKGTNVGASVAAIESLQTPLLLIAGGQGKGQDFQPLADALERKSEQVRHVVLIGEDRERIGSTLSANISQTFVSTMDEAVTICAALARSGDTVLLSPACASFDQFDSYRQRGDAFIAAWRAL